MKHKLFDSKKKLIIFLIIVFVLFSISLVASLFMLAKAIDSDSQGQAFAGAVSSVATLIGSILIMVQLRGESSLNCAKMLSDLNFSFIENERLMLVYRELQKAYNDPNYQIIYDNDNPNRMHDEDLMAYITFYETLNEYFHHGVLTIGQMNDLFGDRFFKLIHNRDVQERELYAEPSSYVNIFELYGSWLEYRKKCEANKEGRIAVRQDLRIPDIYIYNKTYMKEAARIIIPQREETFKNKNGEEITLTYRRLFPRDIYSCLELQEEIVKGLDNPVKFVPTTEDEFYESFLVDYCYGLFDGDKLVAIGIIVLNRDDPRNLGKDIKGLEFSECITFDSVEVREGYRGYGIHNFFLNEAMKVADICNAKYLLATVSPENTFSKKNFLKNGYEVIMTVFKYNNVIRDIVRKKL